jgi:hypothetical protein
MHAIFPFGVTDELESQLALGEMRFNWELLFGTSLPAEATLSATQTATVEPDAYRSTKSLTRSM